MDYYYIIKGIHLNLLHNKLNDYKVEGTVRTWICLPGGEEDYRFYDYSSHDVLVIKNSDTKKLAVMEPNGLVESCTIPYESNSRINLGFLITQCVLTNPNYLNEESLVFIPLDELDSKHQVNLKEIYNFLNPIKQDLSLKRKKQP